MKGRGPAAQAGLDDEGTEGGTDCSDLAASAFVRLNRSEDVFRPGVRRSERRVSAGRRPFGVSETKSPSRLVPPGSGGREREEGPGFSGSGATEVNWDTALRSTSLTA